MGTEYWLVDKDAELRFDAGKLSKVCFEDYVTLIKKLKKKVDKLSEVAYGIYMDEVDLREGKVTELNLSQLEFLLRCKQHIEEFPVLDRPWLPFIYFVEVIEKYNHDWDYRAEYKMGDYEDYQPIGSWIHEEEK